MATKRLSVVLEEANEITPNKIIKTHEITPSSVNFEVALSIKKRYIKFQANVKRKLFEEKKFVQKRFLPSHNDIEKPSKDCAPETNCAESNQQILLHHNRQGNSSGSNNLFFKEDHSFDFVMRELDKTKEETCEFKTSLKEQQSTVATLSNRLAILTQKADDLKELRIKLLLHDIKELNKRINAQFDYQILSRILRMQCSSCNGINICYELDDNELKEILYNRPSTKPVIVGKLFDQLRLVDKSIQEIKSEQFIYYWNKRNILKRECESLMITNSPHLIGQCNPLGISLCCKKCSCRILNIYKIGEREPKRYRILPDINDDFLFKPSAKHDVTPTTVRENIDIINTNTSKPGTDNNDTKHDVTTTTVRENNDIVNTNTSKPGTDNNDKVLLKTTDTDVLKDIDWLNDRSVSNNYGKREKTDLETSIAKSISELTELEKAIRVSAHEYKMELKKEKLQEEQDLKRALAASISDTSQKYELYKDVEEKQRRFIETLPEKDKPGTSNANHITSVDIITLEDSGSENDNVQHDINDTTPASIPTARKNRKKSFRRSQHKRKRAVSKKK